MDGLTFISTMVGHLAWPLAAVIIALVFRKKIGILLARPAKRWKVGPVEAEWEETAAEATVELAKSPEADSASPTTGEDRAKILLAIAETSPETAVMGAAAQVEAKLRAYIAASGIEVPPTTLMGLGRAAQRHDLLSPEIVDVIERLRLLRNIAAHAREPITREQATEFVLLAEAVLSAIEARSRTPRQAAE